MKSKDQFPESWEWSPSGSSSHRERGVGRGQVETERWPNEREMLSRWRLTPWSRSTVQMSGRACRSSSWTSKAWKPTARKHKAGTEPPQTLERQAVCLPLKRSLTGIEAEGWMDQVEKQLAGVPKSTWQEWHRLSRRDLGQRSRSLPQGYS